MINQAEVIMDAAKTDLYKLQILVGMALLAGAALPAQAQTLVLSNTSVLLGPGGDGVTVTSSDSQTPIAFNASITYEGGDPQWIQLGTLSCAPGATVAYTTPATLSFVVGCQGGQLTAGIHTASINLTSTSPAGLSASITVTYNGGAAGPLVPSQSPVGLAALSGGSADTVISLSTPSLSPISYVLASPPASWLSVTPASGSASFGAPASLNLLASAASFTNGTTVSTSFTLTYSGGSVIIGVTLDVGETSPSGGLSLSAPSINWTFASGGTLPASETMTVAGSSALYYNVSVTGATTFLTVNGVTTLTNSPSSTPLVITPSAVISSLATGSYVNTITVTDSNNLVGTLFLTLVVNGGTSSLTVSPNPISLATTTSEGVSQQVTITSTVAGTYTVLVTTPGLSVTPTGGIFPTGGVAVVTVIGNPTGLSGGVIYNGYFTVVANGSVTQSVGASFAVGPAGGNAPGAVAPTAMTFTYEPGVGQAIMPQSLTIGGNGTYTISAPTVGWIHVGQSMGSSPANVPVTVDPSGLTAGSTNMGVFTVTDNVGGVSTFTSVTVTLVVSSSAVVTTNPGSINLSYSAGQPNPFPSDYLNSSDGSTLSITASSSASWMIATLTSGSTPATLGMQIDASSLPNGVNSAAVTITSTDSSANVNTTIIPVVMSVTGSTNGSGLAVGAPSLSFSAVTGGQPPANQAFEVSAPATTSFTASSSVTTPSGGTWLSITPTGTLTTNQAITVLVNQVGLPAGTYKGSIKISASGVTDTVPVTLVVSAGGGNITAAPTSFSFSYSAGGSPPAAQNLSLTNAISGTAGISFTISSATANGGNWLTVANQGEAVPNGSTLATPLNLSISANPTGLATGVYTANITISPAGGTPFTVPVTLTVNTSTVSVSPAALSFSYQAGAGEPASQTVAVAGSLGTTLSFTAAAASTGNWLSVSPTSGNQATTLTVSVSPGSLTPGTYTGTITVTATAAGTGSATVNVTLTVTPPLPTVTAVVSAASYAGGAIAPGEIVSIFGTSLGPVTGVGLQLDSSGKVATSLASVTVSVSGYLAPLTYVSSTQINAVIPYEVAAAANPFVQVTYLGQTSNAYAIAKVATLPGVFSQNGSGTGPGAVLNGGVSVNGPANPAAKGSTIAIYLTGEGTTTSPVTGAVTAVAIIGGQVTTPQPLATPVAVFINGQAAEVTFYGEAPGFVAGVLQVNAVIPAGVPSGNLPLSVQVGSATSQTGITLSVQ